MKKFLKVLLFLIVILSIGFVYYSKVYKIKNDKEYKISVPEKEYYMVYCSVPNETESTFLDINNVKFYNKSDNDITDDILKG